MKIIKTKTVLKTLDNKDIEHDNIKLTIGVVISNVLSAKVSNPTLGYVLAKKFATEDEVDLKAEEIVFIKNEVEKNEQYYALVTGQVLEILEASDNK